MEYLESIRKRPGMYAGPIEDGSGLHAMLFEVVSNALMEGLRGHCRQIDVSLAANGSILVRDDGRGIPVAPYRDTGVPIAEYVITTLHAYLGHNPYNKPDTLWGPGLGVVAALSDWFELRIHQDGREHFIRCEHGRPIQPLRDVGPASGVGGTEVAFLPSRAIFTMGVLDRDRMEQKWREWSALNAGVTLTLTDKRGVDPYQTLFHL